MAKQGPDGVMVSWDPALKAVDLEVPTYPWTPLLTSGLNGPTWSPVLKVTQALGLPLRYMPCLVPTSTDPNQTFKTFAKFDMPGEFVFRRDDAQDLKPEDVKTMEAYVNATPESQLSAQGFKAFFASYSAQMGWANAICPI